MLIITINGNHTFNIRSVGNTILISGLVHGEGDNLPGLIIDVYDHTAVMQAHSAGMHVYRMEIADALSEVMGDVVRNIYYKSETTLPFKADLEPENGFIKGGSSENIAMEYGLKFHVDWLKGQKTGFFVDQRENRHLLERYAKGRNGALILSSS